MAGKGSWAVLVVGGTTGETYGIPKRPWPDPGQQVSFLETLGAMYSSLLATIGKDRIIVIAGLNFVLGWLEQAAELGHPPCAPEHVEQCIAHTRVPTPELRERQKAVYRERRDRLMAACKDLLEAGGPDYDFERVNPSSVLNVLTGRAERPGDRVIISDEIRSLFLWITTHGGHHSIAVDTAPCGEGDAEYPRSEHGHRPVFIDTSKTACDMCGEPHVEGQKYDHSHSSLRTREWFLLMPHKTKDVSLYSAVSTAGRDMSVDGVHRGELSPLSCIYWQQLFSALAVHCMRPDPPTIVILHQFCTSGGHMKWMQHNGYRTYYNVHHWPVYQMATSKELQYSLGATFSMIYLDVLKEGGGRATLEEVFTEAERRYWAAHKLEAEMNANAASPTDRFGELVRVAGDNVANTPSSTVFWNSPAASL